MKTFREGQVVLIRDRGVIAPIQEIRTLGGQVMYFVDGKFYYPEDLKAL